MSGFGQSLSHHWNFSDFGVCNGMDDGGSCIYDGHSEQRPGAPGHVPARAPRVAGPLARRRRPVLGGTHDYTLSAPVYDPLGQRPRSTKMIEVHQPNSDDYWAIEYRKGNDGQESNDAAWRLGWDWREAGLPSGDAVFVYYVEPGLYKDNLLDRGDATLQAILPPRNGANYCNTVCVTVLGQFGGTSRMFAGVRVTSPDVTAPLMGIQAPSGWSKPTHVTLHASVPSRFVSVDDDRCAPQARVFCHRARYDVDSLADGIHTVRAFAVLDDERDDEPGLPGQVATAQVKIDGTAPTTVAVPYPVADAAGTVPDGAIVQVDGSDVLSGIASTEYRLDGGPWTPTLDGFPVHGEGPHLVEFHSTDNVGNVEDVKTRTFEVAAPAAPSAASPTCSVKLAPARIAKPNGRWAAVSAAVKRTAGTTLKLAAVVREGSDVAGVNADWKVGTADRSGHVRAYAGAQYRIAYSVKDRAGATGSCSATVTVAAR